MLSVAASESSYMYLSWMGQVTFHYFVCLSKVFQNVCYAALTLVKHAGKVNNQDFLLSGTEPELQPTSAKNDNMDKYTAHHQGS